MGTIIDKGQVLVADGIKSSYDPNAIGLYFDDNKIKSSGAVFQLGYDLDLSPAASDILMRAASAAALEISDGTTKFYAFDTRVTTVGVTTHALDISDYTLASAANAVATGFAIAAHTLNLTGTTQVTSVANTANIGARTIAGDTATITVNEANTLSLVAPTEGTNVTLTTAAALHITDAAGTPTNQYGIYIDSLAGGTTANRAIYLAGANSIEFGVADDIIFPAATAAALELSDGTTKFLAFDTRVTTVGVTTTTFNISAYTLASAANAVATGWSFAAHTLNLTGTTQVTSIANTTSIGARTIAGDTATITVDEANTLSLVAPTEGTNVTLTTAAALHITDAAGTPTNQYGIYIDSLAGGTTANRALYIAGANSIQFGVADDIIFPAATAAALELSDGTTKYYAIDSRVATASVTTHTFSISAYTIASGATNVETGLSLAAHTLNYTGTTQVTSEVVTVNLGARTIAGDTATLTVDKASTLKLVAPTEGTNVTLTAASAIRIADAGGTPTNQYGIYIETLTAGATADYAIWIAGANAIHMGTAGTATGLFEISGATSGTVTVTVAAAAGTWTMTLPPDDGTNGDQLTVASGDGVCTWAAAASERALKEIAGEHDPNDALAKLLGAKVYDFHYKPGKGTQDRDTDYVGVVAEEAPWAMHYKGSKVNPINTFGYTVLGFQALERRIRELEARLGTLN